MEFFGLQRNKELEFACGLENATNKKVEEILDYQGLYILKEKGVHQVIVDEDSMVILSSSFH